MVDEEMVAVEPNEQEPEVPETPEEPDRSPLADEFEQTFGVNYETCTPEQREAMWSYALKTKASQPDPSSETPGPETLSSEYLERLGTLNDAEIDAAITKAESDGDYTPIGQIVKSLRGALQEMPAWFNEAIGQLDGTVTDLKTDRDLTAAIRKVPDATDADVEVARQIYQGKEAGSWQAALELAMYRSRPKRDVDTQAHRKRKAVAADAAAKGSDPTGRPMAQFPHTPEEWKEIMLRDAQDGTLINDK